MSGAGPLELPDPDNIQPHLFITSEVLLNNMCIFYANNSMVIKWKFYQNNAIIK